MFIKKFFAVLASLAVLSPIAMHANAQSNFIVIDQAKIMTQSKAGKDINAKLKTIAEQANKELKPTLESLQAEEKSLNETLAPLNQNAIRQNEALVTRIQSFQQRSQSFQQKSQVRAAELELTRRDAWQQFFKALEPALQSVIDENNADVVLDRSSTVHASAGVDRTDAVIAKLDASTPTINVTKQSLPTQSAQQ